MPDNLSFFTLDDDGSTLVPTALAISSWSETQLHGVAVSGALARAAESAVRAAGRTDLRAARWTVDLFRPVRTEPLAIRTEVVRESARLLLVDVAVEQEGRTVTRAAGLFLKPTETPDVGLWAPAPDPLFAPPPLEVAPATDEPHVPFVRSDADWSQDFGAHQNAGRKSSWNHVVPVVPQERPSGFVAAAATADGASLTTNWGARGVEHINTDLTLTLTRLPEGLDVGLTALHRSEHDGIAAGTSVMFDRAGVCGTVQVTALANSRRAINFEQVRYEDDGTRVEA